MATLSDKVAASGDDGWSRDTGDYQPADTNTYAGYLGGVMSTWLRFAGVDFTVLAGAAINTASITIYFAGTGNGNPLTKLYAEDAPSPAAPTSRADHTGKTRTTAGVDWDGDPDPPSGGSVQSPDIASVIQELADSYTPTVIQILHDDDGSDIGASNNMRYDVYDNDTLEAADLDIDYTAAGGTIRRYSLPLMGAG